MKGKIEIYARAKRAQGLFARQGCRTLMSVSLSDCTFVRWDKEKKLRRYPAVLIGRLGVNSRYAAQGIGSQMMDFIKAWFIDEANKTGCRFIIVDAYNDAKVLAFYEKNGFQYLFSTEEQEAEYTHWGKHTSLHTRLMFFDLFALIED